MGCVRLYGSERKPRGQQQAPWAPAFVGGRELNKKELRGFRLRAEEMKMIVALAGRRIDMTDASPARFPRGNVEPVRAALRSMFERLDASALVCSAACGADLLALVEAGRLGLRRRVVLPLPVHRFRQTSVIDRGREWGPIYDTVIEDVSRLGDLVEMTDAGDGDLAYAAANRRILDEAVALGEARGEDVGAVLVWDGESRGADDLTEAFGSEARNRHLHVIELSTR